MLKSGEDHGNLPKMKIKFSFLLNFEIFIVLPNNFIIVSKILGEGCPGV